MGKHGGSKAVVEARLAVRNLSVAVVDRQEDHSTVLCPSCRRGNHIKCLGEPCECERCVGSMMIGGSW
jgi:hypothetical protein